MIFGSNHSGRGKYGTLSLLGIFETGEHVLGRSEMRR